MPAKKQQTKQWDVSKVLLLTVVLLIGWVFGYVIGSAESSSTSDDSDSSETAMVHPHEEFKLDPKSDNLPTVKVLAEQDEKAGWNISLITTNFTFTPEDISGDDVAGEGHAHLYVDGEKITRLYGNHFYLGEVSEGDHEITVTLNTNTHKDFTVDGELVSGMTTITETRTPDDTSTDHHSHDDSGEAMQE